MSTIFKLCVILLFFPLGLNAQEGEYQKVVEAFRKKLAERKYETELTLRFYNSQRSVNPIQTEKIRIQVYNEYIHYQAGSVEVFVTPQWILNIDHEQRTILINNATNKKSPKFKESEVFMLDSALLSHFDSRLIDKTSNVQKFRITPKGEDQHVKTAIFTINTEQLVPINIDVFYAVSFQELFGIVSPGKENYGVDLDANPRLTIEYKSFRYNSVFESKFFEFKEFAVFNGKTWELGAKTQQYKLIDYSTRKPSRS